MSHLSISVMRDTSDLLILVNSGSLLSSPDSYINYSLLLRKRVKYVNVYKGHFDEVSLFFHAHLIYPSALNTSFQDKQQVLPHRWRCAPWVQTGHANKVLTSHRGQTHKYEATAPLVNPHRLLICHLTPSP